jgi:PAS domain S-box-containing protein
MWRFFGSDRQLRNFFLVLQLCWLLVLASAAWINDRNSRREIIAIAAAEARMLFSRDLSFRHWAAEHGGVYVPATEETPPNPYLSNIPERDLTTPSGRALTLMNPAYMVRQINESFWRTGIASSHLTSLKPLRPENAPDDWERETLLRFASGREEHQEIVTWKGETTLRYMKAMLIEEPCLKCHAHQGYQVGDIRGGISISLPLSELLARHAKTSRSMLFWQLLIYLLGAYALFQGQRFAARKIREREEHQIALRASEEKFRTLADFTYAWEYWLDQEGELVYVSPSVEQITGYTPRELMREPELILTLVGEEQEKFLNHLRHDVETANCEFDFRILTRSGEERWLHHLCRPIYDRHGKFLGRRASNYDITAQKLAEQQREVLISELRAALEKVKLLSGFLPICANCKKIRDDRGYWKQIESYISDHSNAVFSHGICPECKLKLYPEFCNDEHDE